EELLSMSQAHIHWYGKEKRPGRKMGHINVCGNDQADLEQQLQSIAQWLDADAFPALHQK
ncbi:5-(carboxyamino)imidazole ribonucleotide synthase, partial [Vibrio cyclitrophicus]